MKTAHPFHNVFLRYGLLLIVVFSATIARAQSSWPVERKERAQKAAEERMAFAASKDYAPYGTAEKDAAKNSEELMAKNDFDGAQKVIKAALEKYTCNITLWQHKAVILRRKGDAAGAAAARERWMSLADSILLSGDGKSFETAYKVISVDEEYDLLRLLRKNVKSQALVENKGVSYDKLELNEEQPDMPTVLYFNVDLPKKHLQKMLSGNAK